MEDSTAKGGTEDGTGVTRRATLAGLGGGGLALLGSGLTSASSSTNTVFLPLQRYPLEAIPKPSQFRPAQGNFVRSFTGTIPFDSFPTVHPIYMSISGRLMMSLTKEADNGIYGVDVRLADRRSNSVITDSVFTIQLNNSPQTIHDLLEVDGGSTYLYEPDIGPNRFELRYGIQGPMIPVRDRYFTEIDVEFRHDPLYAFDSDTFGVDPDRELWLEVWMEVPESALTA